MDPELGDIADGDVLVKDGRIVSIGKNLSAAGARLVDAKNMIVMPGLVETPMAHVELEAAEAIDSGITTVQDWRHNPKTPAHALVMISTQTVNMGMFTDAAHRVVEAASPSNAALMMVDGRILKEHGKLTTANNPAWPRKTTNWTVRACVIPSRRELCRVSITIILPRHWC